METDSAPLQNSGHGRVGDSGHGLPSHAPTPTAGAGFFSEEGAGGLPAPSRLSGIRADEKPPPRSGARRARGDAVQRPGARGYELAG